MRGIQCIRSGSGTVAEGGEQHWRTLRRPNDGDVVGSTIVSGSGFVTHSPSSRESSTNAMQTGLAILQPIN
jgi:hypothetical protein